MALGGGTFTSQNKVLPGAYINFVSVAGASEALSARGFCTMPLELDWGIENEVFTVTSDDFYNKSVNLFGYSSDNDKLKGLRDLFINAQTLYAYRVNGGGVAATNTLATALYSGVRGNDIKIAVQANVDDATKFDVITYLDTDVVDMQTVADATGLVANGYVTFKSGVTLAVATAAPLTGGTNGTADGDAYQAYADKIESYSYHTMGIATDDATTQGLFVAFNKRLRDEMGIKFQLVLHNNAADYMGVINVKNDVTDATATPSSLVYWVTGAECACPVNASCTNKVYDGEFTISVDYTQVGLVNAIKAGEFTLHRVNDTVRVLTDINSMVTTTDTTGDIFKDNQTIRVIDQLANDDALLFNTKYLGKIPNDDSGRISLWSDLVQIRQALQNIRAIEDFDAEDITVVQGNTKQSVVVTNVVTIINAMSQLYMTTTIQ